MLRYDSSKNADRILLTAVFLSCGCFMKLKNWFNFSRIPVIQKFFDWFTKEKLVFYSLWSRSIESFYWLGFYSSFCDYPPSFICFLGKESTKATFCGHFSDLCNLDVCSGSEDHIDAHLTSPHCCHVLVKLITLELFVDTYQRIWQDWT